MFKQFCLSLLVVMLVSCSGSVGNNLHQKSPPSPGPASGKGPGTVYSFPVKMRPQSEISPGFKGTSFALPSGLPVGLPAPRRVSDIGDTISVEAIDFDASLASSKIEVKGDYLVFKPVWTDPVYDLIEDIAFTTYRIDLSGFSGLHTIGFDWAEYSAPRREGKMWVALSSWERGSWSWFAGPLDDVLTLENLSDFQDENGQVLLTVAVLYREKVATLRRIEFGVPEQRGTGLVVDNTEFTARIPELFVPDLPPSVDLRAGCAAINDQGTWGACTAFAVGDGAYNHELNRLYSGVGWDLEDPEYKVSPKFLYIVSGFLQGFPPDPGYGRYTDQVAIGMALNGIASEANAPYDLQYTYDWSAEALADAQVLRNDQAYDIPCRSNSGILNVKTILSAQQRPVFVSTQLDYDFFGYEPGTVWNYSGPSYGGHAMLIVGYDDAKQAFLVRNSWSEDWGDQGHLWMSYDTLKNPYNWYVQCGCIVDSLNEAVLARFADGSEVVLPPLSISAADGDASAGIEVSWAPAAGATGYRIYRDSLTNLIADIGAVTSYIDESISDQLSHVYWVSAMNGGLESSVSAPDIGYCAQAAEVISVGPTEGSEGQLVRFSAEISGNPPVELLWDFGGGAVPSISRENSPQVVLGSEGVHNASLTLTNSGGSDVFEFEIEISQNKAPISILSLSPSEVVYPYEYIVDATVHSGDPDGYVVLYEWDWEGDGIFDLVTTAEEVRHLFETAGEYNITLRVMDDAGAVDTSSALLKEKVVIDNFPPTAQWQLTPNAPYEPPVEVFFDAGNSFDTEGSIVNYEWDLDGDGVYELEGETLIEVSRLYTKHEKLTVRLRVTDNEGAQGEISTLLTFGLGEEFAGWAAHAISLEEMDSTNYGNALVVGGRPALVFARNDDRIVRFFISNTDSPDAQSDWTEEIIDGSGALQGTLGATVIGGKAIVTYNLSDSQLVYARRDSSNDWTKHNLLTSGNAGTYTEVQLINGLPGIALWTSSGTDYARATTLEPASSGDWVIMPIGSSSDSSGRMSLIDVGGIPHLAFQERDGSFRLTYGYASGTLPDDSGDWSWHYVDGWNTGYECSLGLIAGLPAIVYSDVTGPQQVLQARADSLTPTSSDDWAISLIESVNSAGAKNLITSGAVPIFTYVGGVGSNRISLVSGLLADPQGPDDWETQRFYIARENHGLISAADGPGIFLTVDSGFRTYYLYKLP